jgi:hypothetical protein
MTRTVSQNALYWGLLNLMSEKIHPRGQTFSPDTFHLWAKSKFLGCVDHVLPSGKTLTIPNSTAALDTQQFSDYLDKVQAFAAERGVYLADMEAA